MRGRLRQTYLAKDYEYDVIQKGKCILSGDPSLYQPLFRTIDFPSKGFRTTFHSWIARRETHFMSVPEFETALVFHAPRQIPVLNICEQVALDPGCTRRIAQELGVKHPAVREDDIIMSTDLVVTELIGPFDKRRAIAVKREKDLSRRVFEKLAIERRYWTERGIPWTLQLDTELPRCLVDNMHLLHPWYDTSRLSCDESQLAVIQGWIEKHIRADCALPAICRRCDQLIGLEPGSSLGAAYHLFVHGIIPADLSRPLI